MKFKYPEIEYPLTVGEGVAPLTVGDPNIRLTVGDGAIGLTVDPSSLPEMSPEEVRASLREQGTPEWMIDLIMDRV